MTGVRFTEPSECVMLDSLETKSRRWLLRHVRRRRVRAAQRRARTLTIVSAASLVDGYAESLGRACNDDGAVPLRRRGPPLTLVQS